MGWCSGDVRGSGILEQTAVVYALKLPRTFGSVTGDYVFSRINKEQNGANTVRQRNYSGVHQPPRWEYPSFVRINDYNMGNSPKPGGDTGRTTSGGRSEPTRRRIEPPRHTIRVAPSPKYIYAPGSHVGSTYRGQVCGTTQHTFRDIQLSLLRPRHQWSRCDGAARLEHAQQFYQPAFLDAEQNTCKNSERESSHYGDCTQMACTEVVQSSTRYKCDGAHNVTKQPENVYEDSRTARTNEKSKMENISLESLWRSRLSSLGWSKTAIKRLLKTWAPTTLNTYNKALRKLNTFCLSRGVSVLYVNDNILSEYMCDLAAKKTNRPKSVLSTTNAAIACMKGAMGRSGEMSTDIYKLIDGLIKSGTTNPMNRSKVMPVENFRDMFLTWPGNYMLTLEDLRLKCMTLLALSAMTRPSDVAPLSTLYDEKEGVFKPMVLSTENIRFNTNGSMTIIFHGIKNDYDRNGFEVNLPPASNPRLDVVRALRCYIQRTKYVRPANLALFLSLKKPYSGITATTAARILDKAIDRAGLKGQGFTAKHFRPTAATLAVESGIDPDCVRMVGRWRNRETFENHYVHAFPTRKFTDLLLKYEKE